jgi:hypothetical protein
MEMKAFIATALVGLVPWNVAFAHAGTSDPSVIHACVEPRTNVVRIVSPTAVKCKRGLGQPIHWSATGPSGPQGAPGATGATGPAGPRGATGPSGDHESLVNYLFRSYPVFNRDGTDPDTSNLSFLLQLPRNGESSGLTQALQFGEDTEFTVYIVLF